jgi:hypothetical protein
MLPHILSQEIKDAISLGLYHKQGPSALLN